MRITGGKNNEKKRVILNKSFTLIELLVVVAIIGILASLLLPVLGKTRKKAKQVVCKSQLRQINTAMIMYSDDNDQTLPYVKVNEPSVRSKPWTWSLAPYLGLERQETGAMRTVEVNLDSHIFKCPSNDSILNYNNEYVTGYAMPYWAGNGAGAGDLFDPVSITNISAPTDALLLGELFRYMFNGGDSSFADSLYHDGLNNRLFIDGHVGQGFQNQSFVDVPAIAFYWHRWSYNTGY